MFSGSKSSSAIAQDFRTTRKAGIRTAFLVTMLVSGIVPAVCMLFTSTDNAVPFSQYLQQMWSIALLTYPLTIVVAVLTILRKRGLLGFGNLFLTFSILIFCGTMGNAIGVFGKHETVAVESVTPPAQQPYRIESHTQMQSTQVGFQNRSPVQSIGQANTETAESKKPGFVAACLGFFTSYYQMYGLRTFLASILVGMFAGNTASRFLEHVPRD